MMIKAEHKDHFLLLLILLLAVFARLYHLDFLSLWTDELWAIVDSKAPSITHLIELIYNTETHPPGYHFFLRYWQAYIGNSDFLLRLPSALSGAGIVWITYLIGKDFFSRHTAYMAAALCAMSYQLITYSQEARANMLMAFFCLASLYALLLVLTGRENWKSYIIFWICATASSYLHYSGTVFIFTLGVISVVDTIITRTGRLRILKLFFPVLILYAPWIPGTLHHINHGPQELWNKAPTADTLPQTFKFLFGPDILRTAVFTTGMFVAAFSVIFSGEKRTKLILWACIVIPIMIFYIKSIASQSIYNHRHFIFLIPIAYLLIINAIDRYICDRSIWLCTLAIVAASALINQHLHIYDGDRYKHNYRDAVKIAMQGNPEFLVTSNRFFDHYIHIENASDKSDFIFENPTQMDNLERVIIEKGIKTFYYIEVIGPESDPSVGYISKNDLLALKYNTECVTSLRRTRVFRFNASRASVTTTSIPECKDQMALAFPAQ